MRYLYRTIDCNVGWVIFQSEPENDCELSYDLQHDGIGLNVNVTSQD